VINNLNRRPHYALLHHIKLQKRFLEVLCTKAVSKYENPQTMLGGRSHMKLSEGVPNAICNVHKIRLSFYDVCG